MTRPPAFTMLGVQDAPLCADDSCVLPPAPHHDVALDPDADIAR